MKKGLNKMAITGKTWDKSHEFSKELANEGIECVILLNDNETSAIIGEGHAFQMAFMLLDSITCDLSLAEASLKLTRLRDDVLLYQIHQKKEKENE